MVEELKPRQVTSLEGDLTIGLNRMFGTSRGKAYVSNIKSIFESHGYTRAADPRGDDAPVCLTCARREADFSKLMETSTEKWSGMVMDMQAKYQQRDELLRDFFTLTEQGHSMGPSKRRELRLSLKQRYRELGNA